MMIHAEVDLVVTVPVVTVMVVMSLTQNNQTQVSGTLD